MINKDNILEILISAPTARKKWIDTNTGGKDVRRRAYLRAQKYLRDFSSNGESVWLIMPGLRGIGKTTILSQLYLEAPASDVRKFYISLERIKLIEGSTQDIVEAIEYIVGEPLDTLTDKVYLFLDEVQFLEDWGLTLKTVFDRLPHVFIVCTGSSAIEIQENPDIARRSLKMPIYPLCFTEYAMIQQAHTQNSVVYPIRGLAQQIRRALFDSIDERQVFSELQRLSASVNEYWRQISKDSVYEYIKFGTLPFTLSESNDVMRYQRINDLLNISLAKDIDNIGQFDTATRALFPRLLYLLANSDTISVKKIETKLELNSRTLYSMLDALEKTEILNPILPRGSAYKKISKPTKYLFRSPAMRATLCTDGGSIENERAGVLRGRLIEDIAGLYLQRIFKPSDSPATVEYDYSPGGADFTVSGNGSKDNLIAIEVGIKKSNAEQVTKTMEKTGGKYGLVISGAPLSIDSSKHTVFVPFEYFLLM